MQTLSAFIFQRFQPDEHGKNALGRIILKTVFSLALLSVAGAAALYFFAIRPMPVMTPISVTVTPGQGAASIARELKTHGIVRSSIMTEELIVLFGGSRKIQAGVYLFKDPENAIQIALRLVHTDLGYVPVRLTVPEGTNSHGLALLIAQKFLFGDAGTTSVEAVEIAARQKEGYLFPETYFFASFTDPARILQTMNDTFTEKTAPYQGEIASSSHSLTDIVKVASILEEEVKTKNDKRVVADIIWRRIAAGMPLQLDSTLTYVLHKTSAELTVDDLRSDNPYNTYVNKGLPPTPISNPGLESILAALEPEPNGYLFYLSDKDGITHFAKTYAEHLRNKQKYIK